MRPGQKLSRYQLMLSQNAWRGLSQNHAAISARNPAISADFTQKLISNVAGFTVSWFASPQRATDNGQHPFGAPDRTLALRIVILSILLC
jgi:hypothetical protein